MIARARLVAASAILALASGVAPGASWVGGPPGPPGFFPRDGHATAFDATRGRLVLFGGLYVNASSDTWEYDGASWIRGPVAPPAMNPRFAHAMAFDEARSRVVLFGGYAPASLANDTWEYDGAAWIPGPAAPAGLVPRAHHAMTWDGSQGRTLLFGGEDANGLRNDAWLYDGIAWTPGPMAPAGLTPRGGHALCDDSVRARVVLFGGFDGTYRNDTWELRAGAWSPGATAPAGLVGRMTAGAFDASRGLTVIFGGTASSGPRSDAWVYDGSAWVPGAAAPPGLGARERHAVAYDARRGLIVVTGGRDNSGELGDTWELDASGWRAGPATLSPRVGASLSLDTRRNRVVLFGGHDGGYLNDTWEFDGIRWTAGPAAPPALKGRLLHATAYDSVRARVVLWGGASDQQQYLSDTWEYDGMSWMPGPAPPPTMVGRNGHRMAYDMSRARVVLFGGFHWQLMPSEYLSDTWEYDGQAWSLGASPPPAMVGRYQFGMAYDERRGRTVVMGGNSGPGVYLNDVWEYDGNAWTPGAMPPAALTARYGHAMAWEPVIQQIVLFGGQDGAVRDDTWQYDGAVWTSGPAAPAGMLPREGHAMAWSPGNSALVLFGGWTPSAPLADVWRYILPCSIVGGRGPGPAEPNEVKVFTATGAYGGVDFLAYAAGGFGVNVSSGDVGGDGIAEILTAPGPGNAWGPHVRAFRNDGSAIPKVSFFAYGTLRSGANVAGAGIDLDGFAEIVTGAGPGPPFGPHVRGFDFDGTTLRPIAKVSFFAYGTLRFGVNVAGGDVDADAIDEILSGPGPGPTFGPQVRGFDYDGSQVATIPALNFMAFARPERGARVAAGDVTGDGTAEIVAATGAGIPPVVAGFAFDRTVIAPLPGFATTGGGADLGDVDGDGDEDLIVGDGVDPSATSALSLYAYDGTQLLLGLAFTAFPGSVGYGVNASGALLGL